MAEDRPTGPLVPGQLVRVRGDTTLAGMAGQVVKQCETLTDSPAGRLYEVLVAGQVLLVFEDALRVPRERGRVKEA